MPISCSSTQTQKMHKTPFIAGNSTENLVNTIMTTMYGAKWILEIPGGKFVKYIVVQLLAVHLKRIQNNTKCKLILKNRKRKYITLGSKI